MGLFRDALRVDVLEMIPTYDVIANLVAFGQPLYIFGCFSPTQNFIVGTSASFSWMLTRLTKPVIRQWMPPPYLDNTSPIRKTLTRLSFVLQILYRMVDGKVLATRCFPGSREVSGQAAKKDRAGSPAKLRCKEEQQFHAVTKTISSHAPWPLRPGWANPQFSRLADNFRTDSVQESGRARGDDRHCA